MSEERKEPLFLDTVESIAKTVVNPSPGNVIQDFELAVEIISKLKDLAARHPSILDFVRKLFHG